MTDDQDCLALVLSSGHKLRVRQLMLYDEDALAEIASLRAQAAKGLGSSGIGVGVLGAPSLSLALEAGAMIAIGSVLANAAQKIALQHLQTAERKRLELLSAGKFFRISTISNTHLPDPASWFGYEGLKQQEVDLSKKSNREIDTFLAEHQRTRRDLIGWTVRIDAPRKHIHSGDDFVNVHTDVGLMSIRWSQVIGYYRLKRRWRRLVGRISASVIRHLLTLQRLRLTRPTKPLAAQIVLA